LRAGAWSGTAALVVLGARVLAYALAPAPTELTFELQRSVGGPRLVIVSLCSIGLAAAAAAAALGLAVLAVRERLALERAIAVTGPRFWSADCSSPARRYGVSPLPPRGPPLPLESDVASAICFEGRSK